MIFDQNPPSQTVTLPYDIIIEEILPRLPAKSLTSFKSVCKDWLHVISKPAFARTNLKFSSYHAHQILIGMLSYDAESAKSNEGIYLINYDRDFNNNLIVKDFVPLDFDGALDPSTTTSSPELVGTCDGLLCLVWRNTLINFFTLWNPMVREHRNIYFPYMQDMVHVCGFGHVSSHDEYKFVGMFSSFADYNKRANLYVFSFRIGAWRRIDDVDDNYERIIEAWSTQSLLIDDILYFTGPLAAWRRAGRVVGLNLANEQFESIPWMDWLDRYKEVDLLNIRGCLSMQCYSHDKVEWDVWMLKQRDDWDSWQKLFSVSLNQTRQYFWCLSENMCVIQQGNKLKLFDPTREKPEKSQGVVDPNRETLEKSQGLVESDDCVSFVWASHVYVKSFISPFRNTYRE